MSTQSGNELHPALRYAMQAHNDAGLHGSAPAASALTAGDSYTLESNTHCSSPTASVQGPFSRKRLPSPEVTTGSLSTLAPSIPQQSEGVPKYSPSLVPRRQSVPAYGTFTTSMAATGSGSGQGAAVSQESLSVLACKDCSTFCHPAEKALYHMQPRSLSSAYNYRPHPVPSDLNMEE
ncbi:hypothetical protein WJX82_007024 [Trebouxia sp. C0006]